jgi:hypothetical protein
MKQLVLFLILVCEISKADLFGADLPLLTQILTNAIQQLSKLNDVVKSGTDSLNLMKEIHKGINDSLNMLKTADPNLNPGIYKDWENAQRALSEIERIYGDIPKSTSETQIQKDSDQSVAEAVALNNAIYNYTKDIDKLGEDIKSASHSVSPGGAQKLTAETLGVMLHVMNAGLRAQATALKLQAQGMAIQNRKEKAETKHSLSNIKSIEKEYGRKAKFEIPRF